MIVERARFVPALAAAALLVSACMGKPLESAEIGTPIVLDRTEPSRMRVGGLEYRGGILLPGGEATSNLSSLAVSGDGGSFVSVSDRGSVLSGRLVYDPQGHLIRLAETKTAQLCDENRRRISGFRADAEGLARLPDGGWIVSFERRHRLVRYAEGALTSCGPGIPLDPPDGLSSLPSNEGIESVVAFPDGRLLLIAEAVEEDGLRHPAWIGRSGAWRRLSYLGTRGFKPTDAALLPDGGLLVLERSVSLFAGFEARLARVSAGALDGGDTFQGVEVAHLAQPLAADNFEGLAVRPGKDGETLIYIVSDDNSSPLQQSLLLHFALKP